MEKFRGLPHTTTGKSPAELNYNRKFRGKLPDFTLEYRDDLDVRDKGAELKGLSKMHADERRGARYTNVNVRCYFRLLMRHLYNSTSGKRYSNSPLTVDFIHIDK